MANFTMNHTYCEIIVSEMTYNVSMGTLNPTIPYHTYCERKYLYHIYDTVKLKLIL